MELAHLVREHYGAIVTGVHDPCTVHGRQAPWRCELALGRHPGVGTEVFEAETYEGGPSRV